MHGYKTEEVKLLMKELSNKKLDELLSSPKDDILLGFLQEKYYLRKNLDRYLAYYEKHKKVALEDIVALVNVNADYEHYEHDIKADVSKDIAVLSNKYYKLDADYEPDDLVDVKNTYYYGESQQIRSEVMDAFIEMWNDANAEGIYLIINSSYRPYTEQEQLYNEYTELYGQRGADTIASRPGYSEHQTGLALDIFSKDSTTRSTFKDSVAYTWLINNSYKYGFILRYPEGKESLTGFEFEAWHYRYVGKKHAKAVHEKNITYDEYYAYYLDK